MRLTRLKPIEWKRITSVLAGCLVLMLCTGYLAFSTRKDTKTFLGWFDEDTSTKYILVGMSAGMAFGFIDNSLLWLGINVLDSLFQRLPGGRDSHVLAGYGNAFSSTISAFASTFVGQWIANMTHVDLDRTPMWAMAFGILIGCLVGIVVPKLLLPDANPHLE